MQRWRTCNGTMYQSAANSAVQTLSTLSAAIFGFLIWVFWISCIRCWSAASGSSCKLTLRLLLVELLDQLVQVARDVLAGPVLDGPLLGELVSACRD
jgi:hypothetical protein